MQRAHNIFEEEQPLFSSAKIYGFYFSAYFTIPFMPPFTRNTHAHAQVQFMISRKMVVTNVS